MSGSADCPLCAGPGGRPVWASADFRVIRVDDADHPAFYRVIAQRHVAEFSELDAAAGTRCMALVCAVERVLIEQLAPDKINLATLGNMVPHLHWHVIARFAWDSHWPQPVWGSRQRTLEKPAAQRLAVPMPVLDAAVRAALQAV
jgi:diadenosine tetraphosphate (Ap4A) HIT family hydrolase